MICSSSRVLRTATFISLFSLLSVWNKRKTKKEDENEFKTIIKIANVYLKRWLVIFNIPLLCCLSFLLLYWPLCVWSGSPTKQLHRGYPTRHRRKKLPEMQSPKDAGKWGLQGSLDEIEEDLVETFEDVWTSRTGGFHQGPRRRGRQGRAVTKIDQGHPHTRLRWWANQVTPWGPWGQGVSRCLSSMEAQ